MVMLCYVMLVLVFYEGYVLKCVRMFNEPNKLNIYPCRIIIQHQTRFGLKYALFSGVTLLNPVKGCFYFNLLYKSMKDIVSIFKEKWLLMINNWTRNL